MRRQKHKTTFNDFLKKYCKSFKEHGCFILYREQKIGERLKNEGVPDKPGVYLIYSRKGRKCNLLQIGKAGTLGQNGKFKRQKLCGRLKAKQEGMPRQQFFQEQIEKLNLNALVFFWFVTFDNNVKVIPAKAEADLLQAYFDEFKRLPKWNKSI